MEPKVIAYLGNARHGWCTEVHVTKSLEALGHRVVFMQEDQTDWRDVPAIIERERAHMLLWTRTWAPKHPDHVLVVLDRLRQAGVPTASFHLDRYIGLDREAQIAQGDPFWRTAIAFTADGGHDAEFKEYGVNHHWLPPGVYGPECTIGKPDPRRFPHDVVFVGSHPYPHEEWRPIRTALIEAMQDAFGPRFKVWPEKGRPIRGQALADLYASAKVVVGDSCLVGGATHYWSDRVPETLGRGACLVHPEVEGMEEWYRSGAELLTYVPGDTEHAVTRVKTLLADDSVRAQIARQGQDTVLVRDTYAVRMATVLDVIADQFGFPEHPAPTARPVQVVHRPTRTRATFTGDQDNTVGEVWTDDTYKVTAADVRGKVVVDIGANVGAFSVLAAKLGAKRVVAYEPHPETFDLLRANLSANRASVVDPVWTAVMGASGQHAVMVGEGGGARCLVVSDDPDDVQPLLTTTLHDMLDHVGPIDLLKVDCEGAEYDIFAAVPPDDLDRIARIVMEFHGPGMPHMTHLNDGWQEQRWGEMIALLASRGRLDIFGRPMVGGLIRWARY